MLLPSLIASQKETPGSQWLPGAGQQFAHGSKILCANSPMGSGHRCRRGDGSLTSLRPTWRYPVQWIRYALAFQVELTHPQDADHPPARSGWHSRRSKPVEEVQRGATRARTHAAGAPTPTAPTGPPGPTRFATLLARSVGSTGANPSMAFASADAFGVAFNAYTNLALVPAFPPRLARSLARGHHNRARMPRLPQLANRYFFNT